MSKTKRYILCTSYFMNHTIKESPYNKTKHELESLGVRARKLNQYNDFYEVEHLVDNLKQKCVTDPHLFLVIEQFCLPLIII